MPECPACGSTSTKEKRTRSGEGFVIIRDRVCRECGHEFRPPTPPWAGPVLLIAGGLMALAGIVLPVMFLLSDDPNKMNNAYGIGSLSVVMLGGGVAMVIKSFKLGQGGDHDHRIF